MLIGTLKDEANIRTGKNSVPSKGIHIHSTLKTKCGLSINVIMAEDHRNQYIIFQKETPSSKDNSSWTLQMTGIMEDTYYLRVIKIV